MPMATTKKRATTEFGDFQTPSRLAVAATKLLCGLGIKPRAILEPTCGRGAFLSAAAAGFPDAEILVGVEINPAYIREAAELLGSSAGDGRIKLQQGDFFTLDWESILNMNKGPWLVLGNPPWITSSSLGALESSNQPEKSNFQRRPGMDAMTGKSNFDISESMLVRYLDWLKDTGTIAVLCKTAVARKVLQQAWGRNLVRSSRIYNIDALVEFSAAVDACLFVMELSTGSAISDCLIFDSLEAITPCGTLNLWNGHLISEVAVLDRLEALRGPEDEYTWRSGIKHDCSRVMELFTVADGNQNALGEMVEIEEEFLFPMLKGSDIGNGRTQARGAMLVPQHFAGQDTSAIESAAPKTWDYLVRNGDLLSKRGSSIYRNKPQFSIFGIGPYTFAPWKVAICGLYKKLRFVIVGPVDLRPVVFDDTVYFLPCASENEALFLQQLLHSAEAQDFFHSMVHWSDKRPITVDLLKRLSLRRLARALEKEAEFDAYAACNGNTKEPARLLFLAS